MVSVRHTVTASQPEVAHTAMTLLARGNAIDAVVAGVFAAAAISPSVLLGPVQLLVGGAGGPGLRAIDGRSHQPGRGVPRPRGFLPSEPTPPAAHVAVPALPAALAATLATGGSGSFAQVLGPAAELAGPRSPERQRLLQELARQGPSLLARDDIAADLVAAAGRLVGGLLTEDDLRAVRPSIRAPRITVIGPRTVATVPWGARAVIEPDAESDDAAHVHVIAAADGRGLIAIACYEAPPDGVEVPELGLVAPFGAEPVRRGRPRVRPGEAHACAAPIAVIDPDTAISVALGITGAPHAEQALWRLLLVLGASKTLEEALLCAPPPAEENMREHTAERAAELGLAVGVVRSRAAVRPLSDPRRSAPL